MNRLQGSVLAVVASCCTSKTVQLRSQVVHDRFANIADLVMSLAPNQDKVWRGKICDVPLSDEIVKRLTSIGFVVQTPPYEIAAGPIMMRFRKGEYLGDLFVESYHSLCARYELRAQRRDRCDAFHWKGQYSGRLPPSNVACLHIGIGRDCAYAFPHVPVFDPLRESYKDG